VGQPLVDHALVVGERVAVVEPEQVEGLDRLLERHLLEQVVGAVQERVEVVGARLVVLREQELGVGRLVGEPLVDLLLEAPDALIERLLVALEDPFALGAELPDLSGSFRLQEAG
jgi:hypothetical protein